MCGAVCAIVIVLGAVGYQLFSVFMSHTATKGEVCSTIYGVFKQVRILRSLLCILCILHCPCYPERSCNCGYSTLTRPSTDRLHYSRMPCAAANAAVLRELESLQGAHDERVMIMDKNKSKNNNKSINKNINMKNNKNSNTYSNKSNTRTITRSSTKTATRTSTRTSTRTIHVAFVVKIVSKRF